MVNEQIQWLVAAIDSLNHAHSWTGRVHTHKLLFLVKELGLANPPFEFELYDYGPYSFELDRVFDLGEGMGEIERVYPRPGYGPKYLPSGIPNSQLPVRSREALVKAANALGSRNSKDLELIATCLWVERREGINGDSEVVRRVQEIKPKYSVTQVQAALNAERQICRSLVGL